jgi:hypothetical protein
MKHKLILYLLVLNISSFAIGQQLIKNDKAETDQIKFVIVEKDGLFGLITNEGKEIVKPRYYMIGEFGEYKKDWALIQKNCLFGFINFEGKEIIKPRFDYISDEFISKLK